MHGGVCIHLGRLAGCHHYVGVVGEYEDVLSVDLVEGSHEVGDGRVHGLAALHHLVGSELFLEDVAQARSAGNGNDAILLALHGLAALGKVGVVVLQRHVLYLQSEEFAPALAVADDVSRSLCMDVHLYDAALAEEDHGVAGAQDVLLNYLFVKCSEVHLGTLQAEQELCAVSELELGILVEQREIDRLLLFLRGCCDLAADTQEGVLEAVEYVQEACAAAVHDPRVRQDLELLGRMLEGYLHAVDQGRNIFFHGLPAFLDGVFRAFADDGENRSLDGVGDGTVGLGYGGGHCGCESFSVCL